jgi:hypothetical protein
MKRGMTVVMTAVMVVVATAAEDDGRKLKKGPFQTYARAIGRLVKLKWSGRGLALDHGHWKIKLDAKTKAKKRAEAIKRLTASGFPKEWAERRAKDMFEGIPLDQRFRELESAVGSRGSGSSQGMGKASMYFEGDQLSARMDRWGKNVTLEFREEKRTRRIMRIADTDEDGFNLSIIDPSGRLVLVLNQKASGQMKLVHVYGDKVKNLKAESFLDFYRSHTEYATRMLFPVIRKMGVKVPLGPYDERIVSAVVSQLRGEIDTDERKRIEKTLDELEAADYPVREAATKTLTINYARWRKVIAEEMKKRDLSREARSRLKGVIDANTEVDQYGELIDALGLAKDPEYLVEILDRTKDDGRDAVVKQLRKVTDQSIGDDVKAWRAWLVERGSK